MIEPYTYDEVCPPSDKYGTRQIALHAHIGTLYDQQKDMMKIIAAQQAEIADLRDALLEILERDNG